MAENLQSLLERIQKEGIEKAETQAEQIVSEARAKARQIVSDAEAKAGEILKKAEEDAKVFEARATQALEQAARDTIIKVGSGVEQVLRGVVEEAVGEALNRDTLEKMLVKMATCYVEHRLENNLIDVLLSPDDQKEISSFFMARHRDLINRGVEIHVDRQIRKGFRVSFRNKNLYHDFTQAAIAETLSLLLRPRLQEIVKRALAQMQDAGKGKS